MKSNCLSLSRCVIAAQGLLLGLALLTSGSASAQNRVKNPDFEQELAPDNWTIVYTGVSNSTAWPKECGPDDFAIIGRTRLAPKDLVPGTWDGADGTETNYWNTFGLHFKPGHDGRMHAYVRQVVTNLTPYSQYAVSAWITQYDGQQVDKVQLYMEVLGGVTGNISRKTPYVQTTSKDNPAGWNRYTLTNSATTSGQIEIRLHYNKWDSTVTEKWRNMDGFFDHVSVMPVGQTEYLPPYKILALTRTNQDITLQWQTVMNNRYRIQASTNPSDPNSWAMIERALNVDTNFMATGTTFTFKTNVAALFYYDPPSVRVPVYFDLNGPLFFRIYSESFKP
jgi:hypothetical protein